MEDTSPSSSSLSTVSPMVQYSQPAPLTPLSRDVVMKCPSAFSFSLTQRTAWDACHPLHVRHAPPAPAISAPSSAGFLRHVFTLLRVEAVADLRFRGVLLLGATCHSSAPLPKDVRTDLPSKRENHLSVTLEFPPLCDRSRILHRFVCVSRGIGHHFDEEHVMSTIHQ